MHPLSDLRATISADKSMRPSFTKKTDSVAVRSYCADLQAEFELHCPHMSEAPCSFDACHNLRKKAVPNIITGGSSSPL